MPAGLWGLGLLVLSLALVFAFFHYGRRNYGQMAPPADRIPIADVGAGSGPALQPPTPREAADALFTRAMAAFEGDDSATTRRLAPLALDAYRSLDRLDIDARYHVALLHLAAGRAADALAHADTILAGVPDHLLGLAVAAEAQRSLGRPDRAARLYRRFLDAYTPEALASRPEYVDHSAVLPVLEEAARRYLRSHRGDSGGP